MPGIFNWDSRHKGFIFPIHSWIHSFTKHSTFTHGFCFVLYIEVPKIKWFELDLLYQGSANYQTWPIVCFYKQLLLEHRHAHFLCIIWAAFETFLDSIETFFDSIETFFYNRDWPSKPEILNIWSFLGKVCWFLFYLINIMKL